jgi:hypothetical protein
LIIVPHKLIVALELELNKVNPNGPSLKFNIGSSVSEVLYHEIPGSVDMPENRSEVVDISCPTII